ncbi:MAG: TRAP transporter substrate-binding protein DctP [Myxococcales bacterium]
MRRLLSLAAVAALALTSATASAQNVTIKLGTMAPDGSAWHNLLKEMGEKWSAASEGKVKLKVYAGGTQGNEGDMVRKLQIGQLNAAALTVVGLHDIEISNQCVAAPGMIDDQAEYEYVFEKMRPVFDQRLLEKGFYALAWGDTGTVHMFFNKEIKGLADMKGVKMFTWAGDPNAIKSMAAAGFQPVVISSTDILPSLQTGLIQSFATAPVMAFTARWYEAAKTMVTASWGHLPGANIVRKDVWEKIPADLRPKLEAISREMGVKINQEVARMQTDAIAQMKKNGLKVVDLPAADLTGWRAMADAMVPSIRGGVCSEAHFDEIKKVRDEYRASKAKK